MKHLSPAEFIDLLDDALGPERAAHIDRCDTCAASARDLRVTMQGTAGDADVPEPSPLFWDHFSARVRDAVTAEATGRGGLWSWAGWRARGFAPIAATLMVAVVGLSMTLVRRDAGLPEMSPSALPVAANLSLDGAGDPTISANTAEVWDLLTTAAADLEWDAAHDAGMGVQPGTVDRAVQRLNPDELHELARLLQSELKRPGD